MTAKPEFSEQIRNIPLFREFSDDEIRCCLELFDLEKAVAGQCIVQQDQVGDSMYLLVDGRAQVVHHQDGHEVRLAELVPGEFFGEIGLVDQGPRSADVEAITDCTLLKITQATISALAGVYPTAAFKFLIAVGRSLVKRLRLSNRRYIDSLLFPVSEKTESD